MKKILCLIVALILLSTMICCSDKSSGDSFSNHSENLIVLSNFFDSNISESILSGLELSNAIDSDTNLMKEDFIKISDSCFEIYVGLMVRVFVQSNQVKIYTFETKYQEQNAILLFDSTDQSCTKVLTQNEKENLIYSQRKYLVSHTIEISPYSGILLHNALGNTILGSLTFKNCSDTKILSVNIVITPYISGSSFTSRNSSYTLTEELNIGESIKKELSQTNWSNFDSYKITKVTIVFSDGSTIGFNSFDCQFLMASDVTNDSSTTSTSTTKIDSDISTSLSESSSTSNSPEKEPSNDNEEVLIYDPSGVEYTKYSNIDAYFVSGYAGNSKAVKILSSYNNKPVIAIENAFENNNTIVGIQVPEGITSIGYKAFKGCANLKLLTLPSSLEVFDNSAISECPNIQFLEFKNCRYLGNADNPHLLLVNTIDKNQSSYEIHPETKVLSDWVFYGCKKLASLSIPRNITRVSNGAFAGCANLCEVGLHENIAEIGDRAFYECVKLETIIAPKDLTRVGYSSFYGCSYLRRINFLNSSLTEICNDAFAKCTNLQEVNLPFSLKSIGERAFAWCESLSTITIPISVKTIEMCAFGDCGQLTINLETHFIPRGFSKNWNYSNCRVTTGYNNITSNAIYDYVVHDEKAYLTLWKDISNSAIVPKSIDGFSVVSYEGLFAGTDIESVEIEYGHQAIDQYSFYNCVKLTSVIIPESIEMIGFSSFNGCSNLEELTLPSKVHTIRAYAFSGTNIKNIIIPKTIVTMDNSFSNSQITKVILSDGAKNVPASAFEKCYFLEEIILPDTIIKIDSHSFSDCENLKKITLPSNLETIGDYAFSSCIKLSVSQLPQSLNFIGEGAFQYCLNITNITIPKNIKQISAYTFMGAGLTTISFEEGLEIIGELAFSGTKLTKLELPHGLKHIDKFAFSQCSSLTCLILPDTLEIIQSNIVAYVHEDCIIYCKSHSRPDLWDANWNVGFNKEIYNCYWYAESKPSSEGHFWHYDTNGEISIWNALV